MVTEKRSMIDLASEIVAAYVSNNEVSPDELTSLIDKVFRKINDAKDAVDNNTVLPKVDYRETITDDYLICLEDGLQFKSLKRHLKASYNLTPEQYRQKWGLPHDYPMVSPNYAKARSNLAKTIGLGHNSEGRRRKKQVVSEEA